MYGGTIENTRRGKLDGIFNESESQDSQPTNGNLIRSLSQPDFNQEYNNNEGTNHEPASIFVRPGIGSIAFRSVREFENIKQ